MPAESRPGGAGRRQRTDRQQIGAISPRNWEGFFSESGGGKDDLCLLHPTGQTLTVCIGF